MLNESIKVMIVDDHELIREGLSKIIDLEEDIEVVSKCSSGQQAIKDVKKKKPDVLLLDINMPDLNGIKVLKKIRETKSKVKIIMLTVYEDIEYIVQSIDLGANGYILKDSDSDTLIKTVKIVFSGGTYIQPTLSTKLIEYITTEKKSERNVDVSEVLTKREIGVMKEIASGLSNKQISEKLKISEKTVKNHVSSILRKLELKDRTQVAIYAIKNNVMKL